MFSPEDQQINICLLNSNLEEIINDLITQRSMLPELDAQNEGKYRETMEALNMVRSWNKELENLKDENMRLTVKRMHLKLESDEVSKALETAQSDREQITKSLENEENIINYKIGEYEKSLMEKAERFRSTHWYYDREQVSAETNKVNDLIAEQRTELDKKHNFVDELMIAADSIQPNIPENILEILGKLALDKKVKELTEKFEELDEKRKKLLL